VRVVYHHVVLCILCLGFERNFLCFPHPFQSPEILAGNDLQTHTTYCFINIPINYRTPILRRKHQMIKQNRNIMPFMNVFAHANVVRRKRRGIKPETD